MATIPQLAVGNRALQDAMNSWKQPELRSPIVENIESNYASALKLPRKDMAVPKRGIGFYVEPQSQHTTSPAEAQA
jgi:hypothetical protein